MISQKLPWELMNPRLAAELNPVLENPIVSGHIVAAKLIIGTNVINHLLGKKLQGWFIVGINAIASIYDTQASNQRPELTLVLVSSAVANVNIYVF